MSLLSLLINLMHPCWIKVHISYWPHTFVVYLFKFEKNNLVFVGIRLNPTLWYPASPTTSIPQKELASWAQLWTIKKTCKTQRSILLGWLCVIMSVNQGKWEIPTVTSHALVEESIQQRAAVVTEGGAGVRVDLELVLTARVLQRDTKKRTVSHIGHK